MKQITTILLIFLFSISISFSKVLINFEGIQDDIFTSSTITLETNMTSISNDNFTGGYSISFTIESASFTKSIGFVKEVDKKETAIFNINLNSILINNLTLEQYMLVNNTSELYGYFSAYYKELYSNQDVLLNNSETFSIRIKPCYYDTVKVLNNKIDELINENANLNKEIQDSIQSMQLLKNNYLTTIELNDSLQHEINLLKNIPADTIIIKDTIIIAIDKTVGIEKFNENINNIPIIKITADVIDIDNPVSGDYFIYNIEGKLCRNGSIKEGKINEVNITPWVIYFMHFI